MRILKRNGEYEQVAFDKILRRISNLANDTSLGKVEGVECDVIAQKVIQQIKDGITTKELDVLAADISTAMSADNPGYGIIASRISVSNLHKSTPRRFSSAVLILHEAGVVNDTFAKNVKLNAEVYDKAIDDSRDYLFDFFGFSTLEKGYLLKIIKNGVKTVIESPQYMWMRVAVALHGNNIQKALETYTHLSLKNFIHASPTLFNAGTLHTQYSSCYLMESEDSVSGIFKTMSDVAQISKHGGGIGITVSNIRSEGSIIRGTNNISDGIMPMLKVYNEISRYINQGQRKGSIAVFYEPHGADIEIFLEMKKNTGDVNLRARDLFYGLWISDLFMKCVEEDKDWYLMCPDACPGLVEAYGDSFEKLYYSYVEKGMYRKKLKARDLWNSILISQIETGLPYMCYRDAVNKKSNQENLGTITSSNLCVEIMLKHDPKEYAVCNISTISLGNCVVDGKFDFDLLGKLARIATFNLNNVIDLNYYPTPETEISNLSHRPIAVGVQAIYETFIKLRLPFTSQEAKDLNKKIFECIQYNALTESCELAKIHGPYNSFAGSPSSKGIFQHNMWGIDETKLNYDWETLRTNVKKYGLRNSLVTALPPTASTANILGNTSSFEVITSNIFTRTVIAGNFMIVNKYLVDDLIALGLWSTKMKDEIILANGSIQGIKRIPEDIKALYKTTWETSQKETINMSADRAPFIDHSQSLNIFMANPTAAKLSSAHFHGWKKGLKTGSYYVRSQPISTAEKISVSREVSIEKEQEAIACSIDNKEACMMCEG